MTINKCIEKWSGCIAKTKKISTKDDTIKSATEYTFSVPSCHELKNHLKPLTFSLLIMNKEKESNPEQSLLLSGAPSASNDISAVYTYGDNKKMLLW